MSPLDFKDIALAACDDAARDGVEKLVLVLRTGLISAKTPAAKKKVVDAFIEGLTVHKSTHQEAMTAIKATL